MSRPWWHGPPESPTCTHRNSRWSFDRNACWQTMRTRTKRKFSLGWCIEPCRTSHWHSLRGRMPHRSAARSASGFSELLRRSVLRVAAWQPLDIVKDARMQLRSQRSF
jgi:hypothetical protein